jgi:hypothetical protein
MLSPAHPANFVTGVDLVGPAGASFEQQSALIGQLKAAGVHVVRTGFGARDENINFAKRLYDAGIKIIFMIGPSFPPDAPTRPAMPNFPGMRPGQPLSFADPVRSKDYFQFLLDKLEASGIVLAGLELDNEINWADGNRDFPLPGEGKIFGLNDLARDPEARKIAKGYLQYLKVMAALKDVRDHSKLNQKTPIILAGLSTVGPEGPKPPAGGAWAKEDAVSIKATIEFLRTNGLDDLVDFYGVHYYPRENTPPARKARLETYALSECRPSGSASGKPCWITEWGIQNTNASCPVNDRDRAALAQEMMGYFREIAANGRLPMVIYYAWDAKPGATGLESYGIYRCGNVTEAGRMALTP